MTTDPASAGGFSFRTVPDIRAEWGGAARLGETLAGFTAARRALIVTDAGIRGSGLLDPVMRSLAAAGFDTAIFDGVTADPPESNAVDAGAQARASGAGLVIGIGGGSSLDVAKLAAVLAVSDQPVAALYGIGKVTGPRLPLVQVPTTAGTGSEVTNITILSTGDSKMGVVAPQLFADLVLLDAQLTVGLPRLHTAATGIDAMVHAIEAYTSRIRKNPISDSLAIAALRLLSANLVTACETPDDRSAREAMLLGAMLAGQAFANAPVAAVHALAYPLGGRHHIPHGLSNALMLVPVMRFNQPAAGRHYDELARAIGVEAGEANEGGAALIAHLADLIGRAGAPRRLRDVGVPEDDLPAMARDAMAQTRLLQNNPVPLSEAEALALYRAAF